MTSLTQQILTDETENSMSKISLRDGYWFYFNTDDVQIAAWGSAWSGKEIVYLNDDPVSEGRSLGTSSEHTFTHAGHEYRLEYKVTSMMRGEIHALLYKDDALFAEQSLAYIAKGKGGWKSFLKTFLTFFIGGFAVGALGAWLTLNVFM